jgi:TolB-like protein
VTEAPIPEAGSAKPSSELPPPAAGADPRTSAPVVAWGRIKEHKVLQWGLAYLGAALALAHGQELLSHTYHWPELAGRLLMGVLIVGFPIVIALAWYHGHRGMTRFSTPEATVVALLVVIGAGLLMALVRVRPEHAISVASEQLGIPAADSTRVPRASVAVVPFANLTGEAGKEYFSDGMAEELINELTKVRGLKVPARTSSFAYKGRNIDIRQIAHDLGVATILEGSVRSAGERIRVTAQLINAETGYHLWSETYDRSFGDVFKLEDDISAEIVEALKSSMKAQLPPVVTQAPPTQDPEAYRLYLQGRSATGTDLTVAMRFFQQAIARDPRFARAIALNAMWRVVAVTFDASIPNALSDSERDANEAIALDATQSEAYVALGAVNASRGRWLGAESSFRTALQLDPNGPDAHLFYRAFVLTSTGQLHRGLEESRAVYDLAPAWSPSAASLAITYSLLGMDTDGLKYADLAAKLGGGDIPLVKDVYSTAAMRSGHYDVAAEQIFGTLPSGWRTASNSATIKQIFVALGAPASRGPATRTLATLLRGTSPSDLGIGLRQAAITWYTMLHDLDSAFDFANRSLDEFARSGSVGMTWEPLWTPEMRPFRRDPRFQAFVTRLKMFDYWNKYGPPDDCDLKDGKLTCL